MPYEVVGFNRELVQHKKSQRRNAKTVIAAENTAPTAVILLIDLVAVSMIRTDGQNHHSPKRPKRRYHRI